MDSTYLEHFLFLVKIMAIISLLFIVYVLIIRSKNKSNKEIIKFNKLNRKYQLMKEKVNYETLEKKELKEAKKQEKQMLAAQKKQRNEINRCKPRIFVIKFYGDKNASAGENLREEVTAILASATVEDSVLVKIESQGGVAYSYGFAASQLKRIRDSKIKLIVAVDRVAASGGYLMACVADTIIAAPFAIIGSIGAIAEVPNINGFLEKHGIYVEQIIGGPQKRPISMFGKNTEEGRKLAHKRIEETYLLFKDFVSKYRPMIDIDLVGTGEVWQGAHAKDKGLVDEIMTSDEYIVNAINYANVFEIEYFNMSGKSLIERVMYPKGRH